MMKPSLFVLALAFLSGASPFVSADTKNSAPAPICDRCLVILGQIQQRLSERCDQVPEQSELRKQSVYLFLSIFDEIGVGIDQQMKLRIYDAALDGMQCDDLDAGVKAAQKMATQLMVEANS